MDIHPTSQALRNGQEVGGLLNGKNAADFTDMLAVSAQDAWVAVQRFAALDGISYDGFDWVVMVNLTCEPLPEPLLGMGGSNYLYPLVNGGLAVNENFGGEGFGIFEELEAYGAYATLIPEGTSEVNFGFNPAGVSIIRNNVTLVADGGVEFISVGVKDCSDPIPPAQFVVVPTPGLPPIGTGLDLGTVGELTVSIEPAGAITAGAGGAPVPSRDSLRVVSLWMRCHWACRPLASPQCQVGCLLVPWR